MLLLEEDPTFAQELLEGLAAAGLDVVHAREGTAGLERATSEAFDALVVSAELPGINGFRLCAKLRKHPGFATPIVLMGSERTVGFDEHKKLPSRAAGYLRKPVVVSELVAMLAHVREQHSNDRPTRSPPRMTPSPSAPPRPTTMPPRPMRSLRPAAMLKELDAAHEQGAMVTELKRQLLAHEQTIARLGRELDAAKTRKGPPPLPGAKGAQEHLGLRQQLVQKERELAEARAAADTARHERIDHERQRASLEAKIRELETERRDRDQRLQKAEKLALAARADKEQATKRAEDHVRLAERHRAELEQGKAELASARTELAAARAELTRERERADQLAHAHAEEHARTERAHKEAEAATQAELDRLRARGEELRAALEESEARAVAGRLEVEAALEEERAARLAEVAELIAKLKDRAGADDVSLRERADEQSRHVRELDEARAAAAAVKDQHAREVRGLRARMGELEAALEAQRDRAGEDLTRAEERYVRHMSATLEEHRAKLAAVTAQHAREKEAFDRAKQAADAALANERARAKADAEQARRAQKEAIAAAVAREVYDAVAKVREEKSKELAELEARLWAEAEEVSTAKSAAIEARIEDAAAGAGARVTKLETQVAELSLSLERSRRALDDERRQHLEEEAQHHEEIDALEAKVAALETELEDLHRVHEDEAAAARAALEQLQRDHTLIDQAKTLLAEIVSRDEEESPS